MDCHVTYEELAALAAGDLDAARAAEIERHRATCEACRRRLAALRSADAALGALSRYDPPAGAVLRARRALSRELRGAREPEILTLDEVAELLRISLDELEEVVLELPAFELAGQLRVRRSRLLEWVEAREHAYARSSAQTEVARLLSDTL